MRRFQANNPFQAVTTGPIQIGADRPGFYIANDNCAGLKIAIETALLTCVAVRGPETIAIQSLRAFANSLDDVLLAGDSGHERTLPR